MYDHDNGGTAINIQLNYDDAGLRAYYRAGVDYVDLTGDVRRAALERIGAAIDAELGDRPDPAGVVPGDGTVPGNSQLLATQLLDAVARYIRRGSADATILAACERWLAAGDR